MPWYYAEGGRQTGPVEDTAFEGLVRSQVVRPDTLVWRDGMAGWEPYEKVAQTLPPSAPETIAPAQDLAGVRYCSECGRAFPPSELAQFGDSWVCAACKPAFVQRLREGTRPAGAHQFGGFWIRFLARVIDGVILWVVNMGVSFSLTPALVGAGFGIVATTGIVFLIELTTGGIYEAWFLYAKGATPGKMALHLKVVRSDGSPLSLGRSIGRYGGQWLSSFTLLIGYIIAAFDEQKRALHDRVCDTRVIVTG